MPKFYDILSKLIKMLDKKKTSLTIKIVALFIAISFAVSLVPFLFGSPNQNNQPQQRPLVNSDTQSTEEQVQSLMAQADFSFDNKEYEQSATFYDQVMQLDSENIDAKSGLGASKIMSGQTQVGFDLLNQIVTVNPEHAKSQYFLADAAKKLGNNGQAISSYQKYLDLEPEGKHSENAKTAISELETK